MTRMGPVAGMVALTALAALAGCVRKGPPAPVTMPGAQASAPQAAVARQVHPAHPDRVVIAKGETLYAVARRYDVPLRSIIDANHLGPPYRLVAGTALTLPQQRFHVVQPGDTLYRIARTYGVELSTLSRLNHLDPPYALRSGQTLYLPASVEPAEKPVAAASVAPGAAPPPGAKPVPPPAEARSLPQAEQAMRAPAPEKPEKPARGDFEWPVEGRIIEGYGAGPNGTHNDGINIAARLGEPVHAADGGVVAYAGNALRGYGNLVLIKHPDGYMTAYAHNSRLLVKRGEVVKRGQEIATAGETGGVDAPQLHFEIRRGTHALDPTTLLPSLRLSAD